MLDGMLSDKHRLAATFMKEVSMKGSTFCIRKFRPDPFSIVDLIKIGTLDAKTAAYLWLLLEYKMSFMIVGGTGSGKTSMLNALLSLMSQNDKIVTVEEHSVVGGLGSAVAEVVSKSYPVTVRMIGIKDTFASNGPYEELLGACGLQTDDIVQTTKDILR